MGDFDKIGLAQTLAEQPLTDAMVPDEIRALVKVLKDAAAKSFGTESGNRS